MLMTCTLPHSPSLSSLQWLFWKDTRACAHTHAHTQPGGSVLRTPLRLLAIRVQKFMLSPQGYCAAADADSLFFLPLSWLPFSLSLSLFTLLILYTLPHTLTHAAWQEESGLKGGFGRI